MDFFDVIAVLFRRWIVTVPVFLIGMAVVYQVAAGVGTEYESLGTVIVIPAPIQEVRLGDTIVPESVNSYTEVGVTGTLARSLPIALGASDMRKKAFDAGLSPTYELTLDERDPIVYVSAKGDTPAQSADTLSFVFIEMDRELAKLQEFEEGDSIEEYARMEILSEIRALADNSRSTKVMGTLGISVVLLTVMAGFAAEGAAERWSRRAPLAGAAA
ncbi:MAG: hypothetical protein R2695_05215 [Acidimicrobiales bacterium]